MIIETELRYGTSRRQRRGSSDHRHLRIFISALATARRYLFHDQFSKQRRSHGRSIQADCPRYDAIAIIANVDHLIRSHPGDFEGPEEGGTFVDASRFGDGHHASYRSMWRRGAKENTGRSFPSGVGSTSLAFVGRHLGAASTLILGDVVGDRPASETTYLLALRVCERGKVGAQSETLPKILARHGYPGILPSSNQIDRRWRARAPSVSPEGDQRA